MTAERQRSGDLVVVTGMTGAGRSTAAKELEDLGFYVVDNLPPQMGPEVVRLIDESQGELQPIAVVVDVRSGSFFGSLQEVLATGRTGRRTTLLFLEANDEVLVRRQEAARRPHPLQEGGRRLAALAAEALPHHRRHVHRCRYHFPSPQYLCRTRRTMRSESGVDSGMMRRLCTRTSDSSAPAMRPINSSWV